MSPDGPVRDGLFKNQNYGLRRDLSDSFAD
jgi:hypothetical protein